MKKQTILMLIIAVLMLFSCSTPLEIQDRKCAKAQKKYEIKSYRYGCPWKISDSVIINNTVSVYRDTTIFVRLPGETVYDSIKVPYALNFSTPVNILETKYALSKAWIENSLLRHTLVQKQSEIPATIAGAIQNTVSTKERIIKVPYPVVKEVRMPLRWFEKLFIWSGVIAWGLLMALVIYKFRRFMVLPIFFF